MNWQAESEELRERLARLTARVYALEERLGVAQAAREAEIEAAPAIVAEPPPRVGHREPGPAPEMIAAPAPAPAPAPERERPIFSLSESAPEESFEVRVGQRWFSYLGVLAVVLGLGVLLRLAIVNDWLGLT